MSATTQEQRLEPMVTAAAAAALSVVLHFIRLAQLPQGGAVTLASVLPIWVVARRHGLRAGLACGATTGVLIGLLEGRPVHWLQPLLDYPLAYAMLGLAALTPRAVTGAVLSTLARYLVHVASGVAFFSSYAPPPLDPMVYSALYNLFLVPDMVIALALLRALELKAPQVLGSPPSKETPPPSASWNPLMMLGPVMLLVGVALLAFSLFRIRAALPH